MYNKELTADCKIEMIKVLSRINDGYKRTLNKLSVYVDDEGKEWIEIIFDYLIFHIRITDVRPSTAWDDWMIIENYEPLKAYDPEFMIDIRFKTGELLNILKKYMRENKAFLGGLN